VAGGTTSVEVGVAVGMTGSGSVADLLDTVAAHVEQGYRRVKLKIEPGWDVEPVRAVRATFGPDLKLQVDANGSYTLADAPALARLDEHDVLFIEQPLADDDLAGHARLAGMVRTPICLDESITSTASAADALDRGACTVINVKPGRVGGYLEAKRLHDMAVARGAGLWVGGMLETGIGRAANLALAALPGFTFPGDISATDRYYTGDVTQPFVLGADGRIDLPTGPGIGAQIDRAALAAATAWVRTVVRPPI
jgi:O-succinylbenzoate synthase